MLVVVVASVSGEIYIFLHRPIQMALLGTVDTVYKPIAPVEHNDLEFSIPGDSHTYIVLDIKLYVGVNLSRAQERIWI